MSPLFITGKLFFGLVSYKINIHPSIYYTHIIFHTTRVLCDVQDLYLTLRYYSDRASIKQKQTVKNCPVLWHFRLIQPFFPSQPSSSEAKPVPLSAANSPSWPQRSRGNDTFPRQKKTQGRLEMHHAFELRRVKPMFTHVLVEIT